MRGDQLARQWRIIREIEASPDGLTISEITNREEMDVRTIYRDLEALQVAGFPLYNEKVENANRWAFVDTFVLAGRSERSFRCPDERAGAEDKKGREQPSYIHPAFSPQRDAGRKRLPG